MKHAYLIIAHSNFGVLKMLLESLHTPYNDLFVHIDKKAEVPQWLQHLDWDNLYVINDRMDVRWGDVSQIKLELYLFEYAYNHGPYEYYHLLSGVDLPIKNALYIYNFFHNHRGTEFVGFSSEDESQYKSRVMKYHLFTRYYKVNSLRYIRSIIELFFNGIVKRKEPEDKKIEYKKGANWVSITNDFLKYLLSQREYICDRYKYTCCADEVFIQTILWNSPFKSHVYSKTNEFEGCMRDIDWTRGKPYIWGNDQNDFDILQNSNKLFARKFDEGVSKQLLEKIQDLWKHNL